MSWWLQLDHKRGSQPRCASFMEGTRKEIAQRLTGLVNCPGVRVEPENHWMPTGLPVENPDGSWDKGPAKEVTLDNPNLLLSAEESQRLKQWWLCHPSTKANTPNWDIASTCRVDGRKGLLLVEAKAHANELIEADAGKKLDAKASKKSFGNHVRIGDNIAEASACLQRDTKLRWAISRDLCYQMSNRFAMASQLTEMGHAVVLVYLGFLKADEMADRGNLYTSPSSWEDAVEQHSRILFPRRVWEQPWTLNHLPFLPLIRSIEWHYQPDGPMASRTPAVKAESQGGSKRELPEMGT